MLQGHIVIKACPSKLKPDCPQILANRNMTGPRDGGPVSRGLGVAATRGGLGSFWMSQNEGPRHMSSEEESKRSGGI